MPLCDVTGGPAHTPRGGATHLLPFPLRARAHFLHPWGRCCACAAAIFPVAPCSYPVSGSRCARERKTNSRPTPRPHAAGSARHLGPPQFPPPQRSPVQASSTRSALPLLTRVPPPLLPAEPRLIPAVRSQRRSQAKPTAHRGPPKSPTTPHVPSSPAPLRSLRHALLSRGRCHRCAAREAESAGRGAEGAAAVAAR